MRVREIHFSTSLRDIDLARWCMNNLSSFGEERFYLRWNPETSDFALPLYRAQDLRRVRTHQALRITRLASRTFARPVIATEGALGLAASGADAVLIAAAAASPPP